jgi:hypothetical protein
MFSYIYCIYNPSSQPADGSSKLQVQTVAGGVVVVHQPQPEGTVVMYQHGGADVVGNAIYPAPTPIEIYLKRLMTLIDKTKKESDTYEQALTKMILFQHTVKSDLKMVGEEDNFVFSRIQQLADQEHQIVAAIGEDKVKDKGGTVAAINTDKAQVVNYVAQEVELNTMKSAFAHQTRVLQDTSDQLKQQTDRLHKQKVDYDKLIQDFNNAKSQLMTAVINPCRQLLGITFEENAASDTCGNMITTITNKFNILKQQEAKVNEMKEALEVPLTERDKANILEVYISRMTEMLREIARLEAERTSNLSNLIRTNTALKQIQHDASKVAQPATDHEQLVAARAQLAVAESETLAVQTKLTTAEDLSRSNRGHEDTWHSSYTRANADIQKLRTEIADLRSNIDDKDNQIGSNDVRIKILDQDLQTSEQNDARAYQHCQDLMRKVTDLQDRSSLHMSSMPPGSARSHGSSTPPGSARSHGSSSYGSARSYGSEPAGLRHDVVELLQRLYNLKGFNFKQNVE